MIKKAWRYSHFALAAFSSLFLLVASLTGLVLAFEPVMEKAKGHRAADFDTLTLAQVIPTLREKYKNIQELAVDDNEFVSIKYTDAEGKDQQAYVHPATGERLGRAEKKSALFEWTTNLHRSLFLKETGRLVVGITSFLLVLIALSGMALVAQRQKGFRRFFAPLEKGSLAQYYHTFFGRLSLVFILAVAVSGSFLSLSRFVLKPEKKGAVVDENTIREEPQIKLADFPIFRQTLLSGVETVEFPFSDFPEDYFTLKLKDQEISVNQFTGEVLAQQVYPTSYGLTNFSLRWHTGRSGSVWAIILAITAGYILFFIGSGFVISWKRLRSRSKNRYKAGECRVIILAGSENGSTFGFASAVYKQLLKHGEKVYLADLDQYTTFPKAEHLVVMTSTYGDGDPPSNAGQFAERLRQFPQQQPVRFSVVGFGSRSYVEFCQFAFEAHALLRQQAWAVPVMEVVTVDDRSPQDFSTWLTGWTKKTGFNLLMPRNLLSANEGNLKKLAVVQKTTAGEEETFLIQLKNSGAGKVVSGDLLAVYPKSDHRERLYSIGNVNGSIQLSVKLHSHGLGSGFLHALNTGETIKARVIRNRHFHFPRKAPQVVMVCNGTGIAPFLGMISENRRNLPCYLYCGFRTRATFTLYERFLSDATTAGKLKAVNLALSREENRQYVSHLLQQDQAFLWTVLAAGGVVMICGSLSMQKDVLDVLDNLCRAKGEAGIAVFQNKRQVLMDCY